ncbi:MAG: signal peptidase I [Gammaproteobacteria bacterium]|nr:signal peptidase I [Gammaproteobacteria bacterium]
MINLALILTVLTLFTGAIVAVDKMLWKTAEDDSRDAAPSAKRTLVEYSRSFFPVLLFVLVIRSFIFEPFRIPSGSMMPTLLEGDFIFVKKFAYGLRLPVSETKIIETGEPQRGDVVVFRLPSDPSVNYIKRIIGLPGDEIVYARQRLTINGEPVQLMKGEHDAIDAFVFSENLDGRVHEIQITNAQFSTRDGTYRVPEGQYFVMGDNRDRSRDSRFIGAIPEEFLVGEAVRIWMHFVPWNLPDWSRIGQKIQ